MPRTLMAVFAALLLSLPAAAQNSAAPVAAPSVETKESASLSAKTHVSPSAKLKLAGIAVAGAVENREPIGESASFDASAGRVFCWTKILASEPPAVIKHVWYAGGRKVFEISLPIRHNSTRTWSVKSVTAGNWKVEIVSDTGDILGSTEFTVNRPASK